MQTRSLLLVLVAVSMVSGKPTAAGEEPKLVENASKDVPPPKATACEIDTAFRFNDATADEKFANRQVDAVVKIERIIHASDVFHQVPETMDKIRAHQYLAVVRIEGKGGIGELFFFFAGERKNELADLTLLDQTVTIRGFCNGNRNSHDVTRSCPNIHFYDCKIVSRELPEKARPKASPSKP